MAQEPNVTNPNSPSRLTFTQQEQRELEQGFQDEQQPFDPDLPSYEQDQLPYEEDWQDEQEEAEYEEGDEQALRQDPGVLQQEEDEYYLENEPQDYKGTPRVTRSRTYVSGDGGTDKNRAGYYSVT